MLHTHVKACNFLYIDNQNMPIYISAQLFPLALAMGRKRKATLSGSPDVGPCGGRRQIEAAKRAALGSYALSSKLARHIVQQWAWGFKSATEVQILAQLAVDDMMATVFDF